MWCDCAPPCKLIDLCFSNVSKVNIHFSIFLSPFLLLADTIKKLYGVNSGRRGAAIHLILNGIAPIALKYHLLPNSIYIHQLNKRLTDLKISFFNPI